MAGGIDHLRSIGCNGRCDRYDVARGNREIDPGAAVWKVGIANDKVE